MSDKLRCPYCPRRFEDQNALWQHAKSKHRAQKHAHMRPEQEPALWEVLYELKKVKQEPRNDP